MQDDSDRYYDVLHNVRTGIRYHLRRQGFFEKWHRITGVVSLVFSSAAVVAMLEDVKLASVSAGIVAFAQAFDLMFETRKHAELHRDLRQRYLKIEPEVVGFHALTEAEYSDFREKIARIEIDEPPVKQVLLELAQNESARVTGFTEEDNPRTFTRQNWIQRHLPNLFP